MTLYMPEVLIEGRWDTGESMKIWMLEALIKCHLHGEEHPKIFNSPIKEGLERFIEEEIIAPIPQNNKEAQELFFTTEKGRAWLQMILNTPQPRQAWVDEDGKVIGSEDTK